APVAADAEPAVLALVRLAVAEHDAAADDLRALRVRDVETCDEPRHDLQLERVLEVVQDVVRTRLDVLAEYGALLEQMSCILVRELDEAQLVAAHGHVRDHAAPGRLRQQLLDRVAIIEVERQQDLTRQIGSAVLAAAEVEARRRSRDDLGIRVVAEVLEEV